MSHTRTLKSRPPSVHQAQAMDLQAPMTQDVLCPYCQAAASVLTALKTLDPPELDEGAEPTAEQQLAIAQGNKVLLCFTCTGCGANFAQCYWQAPGQIARRVLTDHEGNAVTVGALLGARQRRAALAAIVVPGRMQ